METGNWGKRGKVFLKITFSFFLLYFVLSQIDTKKLYENLKEANLFWLFLAFLFFNFSKIVSSVRLNYYFKDIGIDLSEKTNLMLYYLGMFYNLFLPGGIGGDGYKIYLLRKKFQTPVIHLVNATLLDRVSGLVALLFLASILLFFSSYAKIYEPLKYICLFGAILIYPLFLMIHKIFFKRFLTYLKKTTLLGLIVQILQLISAFFIILALKKELPIIDFLALFLISSVVAVLPLTIGGVGAREFTFLYGLKILGYEPSSGVAFSFLFFLITLLSSAIGVIFVYKPIFLDET